MKTQSKMKMLLKSYLLRKKINTIGTMCLLGSIVALLLVGNQLFKNVNMANHLNVIALEGTRNAAFYDISEKDYQKIKEQPFVKKAGKTDSVGMASDTTQFSYTNEAERNMAATVAGKFMRETKNGRWPQKKNEIAVTESYMDQYKLELGDTICVDLLQYNDEKPEEKPWKLKKQHFKIVGVTENKTGFTKSKYAEVSKEYADWVQKKNPHRLSQVSVQFTNTKDTEKYIKKIEKLLGSDIENTIIRRNSALNDLQKSEKHLRQQSMYMNIMIWMICTLVIYNVFYNRFFQRKKEFRTLRKLGFCIREVRTEIIGEFIILLIGGIIVGVCVGSVINSLIYQKIMMPMVDSFESIDHIAPVFTVDVLLQTGIFICLVMLPSIVTVVSQLQNVTPVQIMKHTRTNQRKKVLGGSIVVLSAVMFCNLATQENRSNDGIKYIHSYVPGDLQITVGNMQEIDMANMEGKNIIVPGISEDIVDSIHSLKGVKSVQSYSINYNEDKDMLLLEKKESLNTKRSDLFFDEHSMQKFSDGQYLIQSLKVVSTDSMKQLVPSYHKIKGEHTAVIDQRLADAMNLKIGDSFFAYKNDVWNQNAVKDAEAVKIKIIGTKKEGNVVLSEEHLNPNLIIVDSETANLFATERRIQVVNIWTEKGYDRQIQAQLQSLPELSDCTFHNANQQLAEYIKSDSSQQATHGFFLILLAGIGIMICFETVLSNLQSRKHEFVLMHKLGLRKNEINRKVRKEYFVLGIIETAVIMAAQLAFWKKSGKVLCFIVVDVAVLLCSIFMSVAVMDRIHKSKEM